MFIDVAGVERRLYRYANGNSRPVAVVAPESNSENDTLHGNSTQPLVQQLANKVAQR